MPKRNPQLSFLQRQNQSYGGDLLRTRKGRSGGRPLSTKHTMHLVLRSSKAKGDWSFWRPENKSNIQKIVRRFSEKYGVKIISMANVGTHLHFQIKLSNRHTYPKFIRAVTAAIAMTITGASRWTPMRRHASAGHSAGQNRAAAREHFWDYRPFSRVVVGLRAFLSLRDYIDINVLEGFGFQRNQAKFFLKWNQLKLIEGTA